MPECKDCYMYFETVQQLKHHQKKFCPGSKSVIKTRADRAEVGAKRVEQLKELKKQRQRLQDLEDHEERFQRVVAPYYDVGQAMRTVKDQLSEIKARQEEVLERIDEPGLQPSKHKQTFQPPIYEPNLEHIRDRQKYLEEKKRLIDERIKQLREKDYGMKPRSIEELLGEIQKQEESTQHTLHDLRGKLSNYARSLTSNDSLPQRRYEDYGNLGLLQHIEAIRERYIRDGGSDPQVIAEMTRMLSDAMDLEKQREKLKLRQKNEKKNAERSKILELLALERENMRLEAEINRNRQPALPRGRYAPREMDPYQVLFPQQNQSSSRIKELEEELERLKSRIENQQRQPMATPDTPRSSEDTRKPRNNFPVKPRHDQVNTLMKDYIQRDPTPQVEDENKSVPFTIFLDFITGLQVSVAGVRLVISLFNHVEELGEPAILPVKRTAALAGNFRTTGTETAVVLAANQPIPACSPSPNLGLVVEYQEVDQNTVGLRTKAWTKLALFDYRDILIEGWWKSNFRRLPIKPHQDVAEFDAIATYGDAVLHYRIVNQAEVNSRPQDAELTPENSHLYNYPAEWSKGHENFRLVPPNLRALIKEGKELPDPPPPPTILPPENEIEKETEVYDFEDFVNPAPQIEDVDRILIFQVDRVKNAEPSEGKVRLTAYYSNTGECVQSLTAPVTCVTSAVKPSFKQGYHVFGLQEATFYNVDFRPDMVLIARFYISRHSRAGEGTSLNSEQEVPDVVESRESEVRINDEEVLVAWGAIPLVAERDEIRQNYRLSNDKRLIAPKELRHMRVNTGTHCIRLYQPPVIDPDRIVPDKDWKPEGYKTYGRCTLRFTVAHPDPRPGSITPSEESSDEETEPPPKSWFPLERKRPPIVPYTTSDGFDLYIDGCRFLPDNVTVTRLRGRILNRQQKYVTNEISCTSLMESDIYNPDFNHRQEFREPDIHPSSLILLKIYTIERYTRKLSLLGYASLKLFVVLGSEDQPVADQGGLQIALNEGAHQCRIYMKAPGRPLIDGWAKRDHARALPGASVLLRIVKAPVGPNGAPITRDQVPKSEYRRLGLEVPKPSYSDRVYYSMTCKPTNDEIKLWYSFQRRPILRQYEIIPELAGQYMKTLDDSKNWLDKHLTTLFDEVYNTPQKTPSMYNLNYIAQYVPKYGFKIAIDGAINLPWHNFTLAHLSLNPPGAFYLGKPNGVYDRIVFTENVDIASTNKCPIWKDSWRLFRFRKYHRHLTGIVHIHELCVTADAENYKYSLANQAWAAVPIFENGFVLTETLQLPLFLGNPTRDLLQELTQMPLMNFLERNVGNGNARLVEGASVIVRITDGRRSDELMSNEETDQPSISERFIPANLISLYRKDAQGVPFYSMVPTDKDPSDYSDTLVNKFKNLVYLLYENDKIFE